MNEGYTVTHYSLQVLYYLGCQTVYIIGMDHSFQQSGKVGVSRSRRQLPLSSLLHFPHTPIHAVCRAWI